MAAIGMTPTEVRLALLKGDYDPIPLRGKNPGLMEKWAWQKIGHASTEQVDLWAKSFPDATNTGALTLRMPTLDVDIQHTEAAEAVEDLVRDRFGDHGYVLTRIGKPPKRAIPFRADTPFAKITHKVIRADGVEERFEFLSDGQQVVVDGVHPDTKQPYRWAHSDLLTVPRVDLPLISAEDAQALIKDAAELVTVEHGYRDKPATRPRTTVDGGPPLPADWVAYFDEDNLIDHDNNAAAIMALIRGGTRPGVVSNLFQQKIRALVYRGPPSGQAEWEERRARRLAEISGMIETALRKVTAQPEDAPLYSEEALALLFAERHGPDFRYLPAHGHWIRWAETQWREDETTLAYDHARAVVREQAKTAEKSTAIRVASAKTVAAVERLSRVDRRIVMAASAFDAEQDVINGGGQIVDLRNGATRPITREDFCLKCTAVAPADGVSCPMWLAFLDRIMNENRELIAFLQRWLGYCLSGRVDEEVLVFCYGSGATLGQWIEERTRKDPRATTRSRDLFADWSDWCDKLNLSPGTKKAFVEDLKKLGWTHFRNAKSRGFVGVALADPEQKELRTGGASIDLLLDDGS
jgi:hypothetical protein